MSDPSYEKATREELIEALQASQARARALEEALGRFQDETRWLEEALRKRTRELNERVKELDCLFGVARLVEDRGASLEQVLEQVVRLLPRAWQHSEHARARIRLQGREHAAPDFRATPWVQTGEFRLHGRSVCAVDVAYLREFPAAHEGPFLRQERQLLDEVARRVGEIVALKEAEADIARFLGRVDSIVPPGSAAR